MDQDQSQQTQPNSLLNDTLEENSGVDPTPQVPAYETSDFISQLGKVIGHYESGNKFLKTVNPAGAMGYYQFTRPRLNELGYGNVSNADFISNPGLQNEIFTNHVNDLISKYKDRGWVNNETDPGTVAGLVMAGHLAGVGGVARMLSGQGDPKDMFGTSASKYFNIGKQAFDSGQVVDRPFSSYSAPVGINQLYMDSDTIPGIGTRHFNMPPNLVGATAPTPSFTDKFKGWVSDTASSLLTAPQDLVSSALPGLPDYMEKQTPSQFLSQVSQNIGNWTDSWTNFGNAVAASAKATHYLDRPSGLETLLDNRLDKVQQELKDQGSKVELNPQEAPKPEMPGLGQVLLGAVPGLHLGGLGPAIGSLYNWLKGPDLDNLEKNVNQGIVQAKQENPNIKLSADNYDDILKQVHEDATAIENEALEARAKQGGVKNLISDFVGGTAGFLSDARSLAYITALGAATGGAGLLGQTGAMGAGEALLQPEIQNLRKAFGLEAGLKQAAENVAGVVGGTLLGGLVGKGISALVRGKGEAMWPELAKALDTAKDDPLANNLASRAAEIHEYVSKNPFENIGQLDEAITNTEKSIVQGEPIKPYDSTSGVLKQELPPVDKEALKLVMPEGTPPAEIDEAAQAAQNFRTEYQKLGVQAPQGPDIWKDINGIPEFQKSLETPPVATQEITPQHIEDAMNALMNKHQEFKSNNPKLAESMSEAPQILDYNSNGELVSKSHRQVLGEINDSLKAADEFSDCISGATPKEPTE